jgi:c-di-GMP-binding flagellar brake protein YcgR
VQRRRAVRFVLPAKVIYRWKDASGQRRESIGLTRDISLLGAFIFAPSPLPVNTPVNLEIELPPLQPSVSQRLTLKGKGRVIRSTSTDQDSGFAAACRFDLRDPG